MHVRRRVAHLLVMVIVPAFAFAISCLLLVELTHRAEALGIVGSATHTAGADPLAAVCERRPGLRVWDGCARYELVALTRTASVVVGASGIVLLVVIGGAGWIVRSRRALLALVFGPLLVLTSAAAMVLVGAYALLALISTYAVQLTYLEPFLIILFTGVLLGPLVVASRGITNITVAMGTLLRPPLVRTHGVPLTESAQPALWEVIRACATAVGTRPPRTVVAVLEPDFYVTEAPVRSRAGWHRGRTLTFSLALAHLLTRDEFIAIIGHECAHFKGADTLFTRYFYPLYRASAEATERLSWQALTTTDLLILYPAAILFETFHDTFQSLERPIGRQRELVADAEGARITSARTAAAALAKFGAFAPSWPHVHFVLQRAERNRTPVPNAALTFVQAATEPTKVSRFAQLDDQTMAHPFDTHPPLALRLEALGVALDQAIGDAQAIPPEMPASELLVGLDKIEEELTDAYRAQFH